MNQHQTIGIFSSQWFIYTIPCITAIFVVILLGKKFKETGKNFFRIGLGIVTLASVVLIHPYLMFIGEWSLQTSLPIHMCELSEIFAAVALIWQRQRLFEILCYWGIPGGIHSILTPELLHSGENSWLTMHYYFQHTIIILAPIFLLVVSNMRLPDRSWIKAFLITNLCIPVIGTINWILGSNYMYLTEKPIANNPFLIGGWPWYIVVLDLVMLAHIYLVFIICTKKVNVFQSIAKNKITNYETD
ncbi:MAG TPA: TIGR02206 family membrane protein [Chitinophagaceae bacterium]